MARAKTPAASGAAADVPECVLVHLPYRSVVATPGCWAMRSLTLTRFFSKQTFVLEYFFNPCMERVKNGENFVSDHTCVGVLGAV